MLRSLTERVCSFHIAHMGHLMCLAQFRPSSDPSVVVRQAAQNGKHYDVSSFVYQRQSGIERF
jgi:hypothetical protein